MTMTYPVSAVHSEKITVPSATAFTGVPTLATMSMAKWLFSELNVCDTVPVIGAKNTTFALFWSASSSNGKRSLLSTFCLNRESCWEASSVRSSIFVLVPKA